MGIKMWVLESRKLFLSSRDFKSRSCFCFSVFSLVPNSYLITSFFLNVKRLQECLLCIFYKFLLCLIIFCPYILKIKVLEMEKLSSQQNLDNVVHLATEQNICAREKFHEVIIVSVTDCSLLRMNPIEIWWWLVIG